ncbi:hypothetical protein KW782_04685 [Candidatus Parcubacteria bacterium]|nr:hypothetical protein [Candidatus Parcubacteria bacterium]
MNNQMEQLLLQLGLGLTSNFIYDLAKGYLTTTPNPSVAGLESKIASSLNIQGADIYAHKIVELLAQKGDIKIEGTRIYAVDSIVMASNKGTQFTFGNSSESSTKNTRISAGEGAFIQGQGGAQIRQNDDGSISFHA